MALVQPALVGEGREAGVLHDGAEARQLVVDQQNLKQGGECELVPQKVPSEGS